MRPTRKSNAACLLALAVTLTGGVPLLAQFEDQPANKSSTLIDKDGARILDSELAGWIRDVVVENGMRDALDAQFFFNQCFGGGFLDDMSEQMGTIVPWVGGSASKHDQTATGQVSDAENDAREAGGKARYNAIWEDDPPFSFWGEQIISNLDDDETTLKSIQDAGKDSKSGKDSTAPQGGHDTGQSGHGNGGDMIRLNNTSATSHHAVIFAGLTDAERHFNTVKGVYDGLVNAWGDPASNPEVTITVLFGDGMKNSKGEDLPAGWNAMPATKSGLQAALMGVEQVMNPNEQFLFYGYDHGGNQTVVVPPTPPETPAVTIDAWQALPMPNLLELTPGELEGLFLTPDNNPVLILEYDWLGTEFEPIPIGLDFIINGVSLVTPFFPLPGQNTVEVLLPEFPPGDPLLGDDLAIEDMLLQAVNTLALFNGTDSTLNVLGLEFFTGAIADNPHSFEAVPEPGTIAALAFMTLIAGNRRRTRNA